MGSLGGVAAVRPSSAPAQSGRRRIAILSMKEALPQVSRVMSLHDPEAAPDAFNMTQQAAPRLDIRLQVIE